ncbi:MAG: MurR/RpiR family transcriptional regulator [Thomasclavelia sp.]
MTLEKLVEENYQKLNENDLYIWQYILHHKRECQKMSIKDLAYNCSVSHTSILRFTKKLGLEGFSELKIHLKWDLAQKSNFKPRIIEDTRHEFINTINHIVDRDLTRILTMIDQARRVFIYGTGVVQQNMASELRRSFLYCNKVFHIVGSGTEVDTILNNTTPDDLFIIISLSGDNETAVTLAKALKGLHTPRIGIAIAGNTLLSRYCDEMLTFRYETFKVGKADILYGSTAHFFIIADLLFLKYLEYTQNN